MQSSSEQPLVGEERYVTTLITAAKETRGRLVAGQSALQGRKSIVLMIINNNHHHHHRECLHLNSEYTLVLMTNITTCDPVRLSLC